MKTKDPLSETLTAIKSKNLGHLLMRAARLFNDLGIQQLRELTGDETIRTAHTRLLPHIDMEGTRQVVLAERVGITKQAVGALVADLERQGTVERVPDPSDGRAKLVRFTQTGQASIVKGLTLLAQIERDAAQVMGEDRIEKLKGGLTQLLAFLEDQTGDQLS
ncbi:MAG: MarR family winged helix-turn-helix transcriptional regulator [Myxococcota bacterium]